MTREIQATISVSKLLIWMCFISVLIFISWSRWAHIDEITRATGQVIASSRNQIIQTAEGGSISTLAVKEGSTVQKGQLLVRFDKSKALASYLESRAKAAALMATISRARAELFDGVIEFPDELNQYQEFKINQITLFEKRKKALNDELNALNEMKQLVQLELNLNLPLVEQGDVSRSDVIRLQRQVLEISNQIATKKNKFLQETQAELSKAEEDLASLSQVVAQRKELLDAMEIFSPMDGVVRNVRITTLGGVARAGEEVMQIVPAEDELIVEAKVRPSDIAFIANGLPATVKFDAYDYTVYGSVKGTVSYISPDTLTEEVRGSEVAFYRVQVNIGSGEFSGMKGRNLPIQAGMTAMVEIKTGQKTVFDYISKPLVKTLSESMGER